MFEFTETNRWVPLEFKKKSKYQNRLKLDLEEPLKTKMGEKDENFQNPFAGEDIRRNPIGKNRFRWKTKSPNLEWKSEVVDRWKSKRRVEGEGVECQVEAKNVGWISHFIFGFGRNVQVLEFSET